MITDNRYLKASEGWTEVARDNDAEVAVILSTAGYLRAVALVDEDDRDLGDYFIIDTTGSMIRPAPGADVAAIAASMLASA